MFFPGYNIIPPTIVNKVMIPITTRNAITAGDPTRIPSRRANGSIDFLREKVNNSQMCIRDSDKAVHPQRDLDKNRSNEINGQVIHRISYGLSLIHI